MPTASDLAPWRPAARLAAGDPIAVIAPSGPLPAERFERGAARLGSRYALHHAPGLLERHGFLAGPDGRRLSELRWALGDPAIRAVFAGRGGHGLLRQSAQLLAIPAAELRPLPVVGFSDVTVLHAFLSLRRQLSVHGPVVTQLSELGEDDQQALWQLIEVPAAPPPLEELVPVRPPVRPVAGRLLGGNLEVLSRLSGTGLQAALTPGEPVVLLLEEVGEAPYRIDRALTQLQLAGALTDVRAIVVGDLVRCEGPADSPTALDVIAGWAVQLGVPVVAGLPVGHGARNRALPLGARVTLEPRRLLFHDAAVV